MGVLMFKFLFGGSPSKVVVDTPDGPVDLLPYAKEVLAHAPEPTGMDAERIAELAKAGWVGAYVKVGEYPEGIDRDYAKLVIGRVRKWVQSDQALARAKRIRIGHHRFSCGSDACPAMAKRDGKRVAKKNMERLPLTSCWQRCQCRYDYRLK
ncbi:hypothetical protein [Pseudaestuariivita sp.]|uniref:hypothetical protein n=1 Tax=Pseudaestuariivita sp. TaxID=2211669 RepID=UPI0040582A35